MATGADAETNAERLAEMFSPILILTKDTQSDYGEDGYPRLLKPEPVEMSGRFGKLIESGVLDPSKVSRHQQTWNSDFLRNKWAFLTESEFSYLVSTTTQGELIPGAYVLKIYLDYPGTAPKKWNDTYLGSGPYADANFSNTACVHTYKRKLSAYTDSVTVIQYFYFYPY